MITKLRGFTGSQAFNLGEVRKGRGKAEFISLAEHSFCEAKLSKMDVEIKIKCIPFGISYPIS